MELLASKQGLLLLLLASCCCLPAVLASQLLLLPTIYSIVAHPSHHLHGALLVGLGHNFPVMGSLLATPWALPSLSS